MCGPDVEVTPGLFFRLKMKAFGGADVLFQIVGFAHFLGHYFLGNRTLLP